MAFLLAAARSVAVSERTPSGAKLLVLGDSWSAEYGLKRGQGWVALLEARLKQSAAYQDIQIVNASVSGETTAGGLSRLPALLERHHPQFVLIALGGNDALRGLPLETTRSQLLAMIKQAKARGASVLLIGMRMPPNAKPWTPVRFRPPPPIRTLQSKFRDFCRLSGRVLHLQAQIP
ncbi:MAG: hypothetical protein EBX61_03550 [Betaproteobacteria bacterium]|nr:hypothetical protein [Betaproteobacteria bacterium]